MTDLFEMLRVSKCADTTIEETNFTSYFMLDYFCHVIITKVKLDKLSQNTSKEKSRGTNADS